MAHPQLGPSVPPKLSFAKIAAMPAPNMAPALPNIIRENKSRPPRNDAQHVRNGSQTMAPHGSEGKSKADIEGELKGITSTVNGLSLAANNESSASNLHNSGESTDSVADDQSQLSASSLKQQSFDTKSMASVTTFAMDEKESIRPDDSASVRAVEEDDVHPGLSRHSSFQQESELQPILSKSNVRMLGPSVTISARRQPYTTLANPPRFGDLPPEPLPESSIQLQRPNVTISDIPAEVVQPRQALSSTTPDEKLIEALSSMKDRLPLLQLEEKIIAFIHSSRENVLELPPQNSFTRLLAHKLADYYNLAHHINEDNNSVRIFRTEYCSSPVTLAEIAKSVPVGAQQISYATQVQIMRRVLGPRQFSAGNSTAASSSVPSKATSENGIENVSEEGLQSPIEGTPSKDRSKLTREEREAQYKAARDRIFGDFQESVTSESGSTGGASASMSRSSSSSGKKKPRKNRVPKDDTFEARSLFIPSYAPMQIASTYPQAYHDMQYVNGYVPASTTYPTTAYNPTPPANFSPYEVYNNPTGFNAMGVAMYGPVDGWQNQQQTPPNNMYNYQGPQQYQPQVVHQQLNNQYQPNPASAIPQSPNWASNQYQSMYAPSSPNVNQVNWQAYNQTNMQTTVPYQYGQLPSPNSAGGISFPNQHPVPGSFNGAKSLFNPQTRSFVPSNTSARGGARGGRKKGQGPGSARTSGTSSPAVSNLSDTNTTKPKEDSLQQKYGTLANLPKKPPPSQVSPHFNNDHSATSTNGPLVVNSNAKSSAV